MVTFEDLLGITRTRRQQLFRLLSAIKACGGILSYYEALKIGAAPLLPSKTKTIGLDRLLKELQFFEAISISADRYEVKYLIADYVEPVRIAALKACHYSLIAAKASASLLGAREIEWSWNAAMRSWKQHEI
ncbi:hypothetical protein FO440_21975 [Mucilaginibacter corticis]|uniref:Uncharacterized protein n=1 Tax=Mucilaginibacter corticis TaxID=2597670 RepID=A0A556M9C5_9SPHI|nr:hypothetical protein [Mucilaginibacter corticis]TSJ36503.1 hypothetical protein FO440_21975 [Mucilaginibacter corticis]